MVDCGKCWIVFAVMKDETKCVRRLESDKEDKADGAGDTTRLGEPAQFGR